MTNGMLGEEFSLDQNILIQQLQEELGAARIELSMQRAAFSQLKGMYNQRIAEKEHLEDRLGETRADLEEAEKTVNDLTVTVDEFRAFKALLTKSGSTYDSFLEEVRKAVAKLEE
jgi:hypothetical protein